jgi:hypothetical protein
VNKNFTKKQASAERPKKKGDVELPIAVALT